MKISVKVSRYWFWYCMLSVFILGSVISVTGFSVMLGIPFYKIYTNIWLYVCVISCSINLVWNIYDNRDKIFLKPCHKE